MNPTDDFLKIIQTIVINLEGDGGRECVERQELSVKNLMICLILDFRGSVALREIDRDVRQPDIRVARSRRHPQSSSYQHYY